MKPLTACRWIANKAFCLLPCPDPKDEPKELATPCWCLKTHDPVGPDGGDVHLDSCRPGRACFQPEIEL